ncbi:MAG: hypothetical protein AAGE52_39430 [Myxococcota bacterium]
MRRLAFLVGLSLFGCGNDSSPGGDGGVVPDSAALFCTDPGAIETVTCGSCGTTERFCTAEGEWVYGVCDEAGMCTPGTMQEVACGACGTQSARCTASCEWEAIGECSGEGGCEPGSRTRSADGCPSGEDREVLCGESCDFEPVGECLPNDCDEPGALETVSCGACGSQERFCTAGGTWEYSICEEEGECVPGTTDTTSCGNCGSQARRCTTECVWDSESCVDEGECAPGETERTSAGCPADQTRTLRCSDACVFEEVVECVSMPMECIPACDSGETCRPDGTCRCGSGPACRGGESCVDGECTSGGGDCPDEDRYGCQLVSPQCGCPSGRMCTVDRSARERVCLSEGSDREGESCESQSCRAGLACFGGVCRRWCESDRDCGGGSCSLERLDIDSMPLPFPADLCTISCDPLGSDCGSGACQITGSGDDAVTDCRTISTLPIPLICIINENCPAGQACVGMSCLPYCRVGVRADCSGTCTPLAGEPRVDGRIWGTCS